MALADLAERISKELEPLKTLRDELRVQIHLGSAEARERWSELESRWNEVEGKLGLLKRESEESLQDIEEAARQLVDEIREGYRHVRKLI